MNGIGSHQSAKMKNDEWLTPPEIIKALGPFDLDPCSPINRPWDMAKHHFNKNQNGLEKEWFGRVWCNPPYGLEAAFWLDKLKKHKNGIALIFARTETRMFFNHVWKDADSVFFFEGRLYFYTVEGEKARANSGGPSCLISYSRSNTEAIRKSGLKGKLLLLNQEETPHAHKELIGI